MTVVVCPDCGANYPQESLANVAQFRCAGCGGVLAGGLFKAPAPAAAAPRPATPQPRRSAVARTAHAHGAPAKKGGVPVAVWIGGGVVVIAVIGVAVVLSGGKGAASARPAETAKPPEPPKPDPMKDVAAWKALAAPERATLAARYVASADVATQDAAKRAAEFLSARGETASVAALANRALERSAGDAWARATLGHADVAAEVDKCLAECEQADEANDEKFLELKAARAAHPGAPWWNDADATKKIRDLVAEVRKAEQRWKDPYEAGIAKWIRLQRATHIMKDTPALHASVGPYLIFVSLNVPSKELKDGDAVVTRDVSMADVSKEEIARGTKILERNKKLFQTFYDGWMTEMGPRFGFTKYGPENTDFKTLMKANVFAKAEDFFLYNLKSGAGVGGFTRAYYSSEEPRFVTTYDGGESEDTAYTDQVQCHEATHQLVHFYTWDMTRKDLGREPDWLEVHYRPLWSGEGFAEFFSSHRVVDGKYQWMQPLDERLRQIWIFEEMVKEKGWIPWRLEEFFFNLHHGGQLNSLARARSKTYEDDGVAEGVMGNLFYARAWSFVYFLWYAEKDGAPKYRDRYVDYLKREFHVRFAADPATGKMRPAPAWSGTFGEAMGLSTKPQWEALEKEWNEFTAKLVAANRKPAWNEERTKIRKNFGFDKPPGTKDEKPKKK